MEGSTEIVANGDGLADHNKGISQEDASNESNEIIENHDCTESNNSSSSDIQIMQSNLENSDQIDLDEGIEQNSGSPGSSNVQPATEAIPFTHITEGKATILFDNENSVFYNKVQCMNRDLSIIMISLFSQDRAIENEELKFSKPDKYKRIQDRKKEEAKLKNDPILAEDGITILEALSASGLRSIRYVKEIKGKIKYITANDLSADAVEAIKRNAKYNEVDMDRLRVNHGDASLYMYMHKEPQLRYDVIDLDPYGSPSIFIDSAVQCLQDGGLLCVTCTDLAVLCGNHMDACFGKYNSVPIRVPYCHELAIRILLNYLEQHCNTYGRYIVPLCCVYIDFYIRAFVKIYTGKLEVKSSSCKISVFNHCTGCDNFGYTSLSRNIDGKICNNILNVTNCPECSHLYHIGGPVWTGPIYDKDFVERAKVFTKTNEKDFHTSKRIYGLLTALSEELHIPFFYSLHSVTHTLKLTSPTLLVIYAAIQNLGFLVSGSHTNPLAVKTNCPPNVFWDIFRKWHEDHPAKNDNENTPGYRILLNPCSSKINFDPTDELRQFFKDKDEERVSRFPSNPEKNWGPKSRAPMKRQSSNSDSANKKHKTDS